MDNIKQVNDLNDKSPLKNVSTNMDLLLIGKEKLVPIIQTYDFIIKNIDTKFIDFILNKIEPSESLEKILNEHLVKLHMKNIRR